MGAAGWDAITPVAVILRGVGMGVPGSTVTAFSTVIAPNAAEVPFTDGPMLKSGHFDGQFCGHCGLYHALCRTGKCRPFVVLCL